MRASARKLRRSWRSYFAKWHLRAARKATSVPPMAMQDEDGRMTSDTKKWSRALQAYCQSKYMRTNEEDRQRALLRHLNEKVDEEENLTKEHGRRPV